jgi:hypothetical protein
MISSEVQRTLVKSPPELWAELSDPGVLARHLGELGEIRITRVEPEQLVEWEAENRTGTVHIKPSGWGTRVTLTVSTAVPEATFSTPPGDEPQAEAPVLVAPEQAADAPAALAEDDPSPTTEDEPTAEDEPEDDHAAVAQNEPTAEAEYEPTAVAEDGPAVRAESIPSPLGVPLTAAAASSWRAGVEPKDVEDPSPGWIAENGPELQADSSADEEPGEAYEWLPYEEAEPRRGFLARLFGRWRRPAALDDETAGESLEATSADAVREPEPGPPAGEAVAESTGSPFGEDEIVAPEAGASMDAQSAAVATFEAPPPDDASAEELEAIDEAPVEPIADASAEEPEAIDEAPVEPIADASAEELEAIDEAPVEPIADASAEEPEAPSPRPDPAKPDDDDIAGELNAAEETADAEVTAVLTSVLDRLGAAHHRPFSRS